MKLTVSSFEASGLPGSNNPGLTLGVHFLSSLPQAGFSRTFSLYLTSCFTMLPLTSLCLLHPFFLLQHFLYSVGLTIYYLSFLDNLMGSQQGAGEEQLSACRAWEPPSVGPGRTPSWGSGHPRHGPYFTNSTGQRTLPSHARFLKTNSAVLSLYTSVILSYVLFY